MPGAGAEFSLRYNTNTTSLLEFDIQPGTGSVEGVNASQYDGYTAAQAIEYGTGRIVYFDCSVLDFLSAISASVAAECLRSRKKASERTASHVSSGA